MAEENRDEPAGQGEDGKQEDKASEKVASASDDVSKTAGSDTKEAGATAEDSQKATTPARPSPPRAAQSPARPAAGDKPAPPAKKGPTVTADIVDDTLIDRIREKFGDRITEAVATHGQQILRVGKDALVDLCRYLKDDEQCLFDLCVDITATHWPDRKGEEFDLVVMLYSIPHNRRIRIKAAIGEGEAAPSLMALWNGADWMEREVFDMFGIAFEGRPNRRILLPEDWPGHPLRKEYPIEYKDNEWTDKHLDYREIDYDTSLIDVKYGERR